MIPLPSRLYAIVDVELCARVGWDPLDLARAYLAGGARLLQLRAKTLAGGAFLDLSNAVVDAARERAASVIINDRADLAALSGAAGVHVGQDDLSPRDARQVCGPDAVVGLSTHTPAQVAAAIAEPISYLAIGPVFSTHTKDTGYTAVGTDAIRAAVNACAPSGIPVVAIGGITLASAPRVVEAGASAVAVISDLLEGGPEQRVRAYLSALGERR